MVCYCIFEGVLYLFVKNEGEMLFYYKYSSEIGQKAPIAFFGVVYLQQSCICLIFGGFRGTLGGAADPKRDTHPL